MESKFLCGQKSQRICGARSGGFCAVTRDLRGCYHRVQRLRHSVRISGDGLPAIDNGYQSIARPSSPLGGQVFFSTGGSDVMSTRPAHTQRIGGGIGLSSLGHATDNSEFVGVCVKVLNKHQKESRSPIGSPRLCNCVKTWSLFQSFNRSNQTAGDYLHRLILRSRSPNQKPVHLGRTHIHKKNGII